MSHSVTTTTAYPETTYTSNTYHQTLLRGFDELRGDAHLCDVTLIAGTSKYPVHRSLLAACSPYFRQMFTKDAASSTICRSEGSKYTWFSESIELRGISSEGLRHIVEFIYTGRIPISMTTVQNILAVARHMQIQAVLDFCMEFLISAIDVNTCVDIIHIAEVFGMPQVSSCSKGFMVGGSLGPWLYPKKDHRIVNWFTVCIRLKIRNVGRKLDQIGTMIKRLFQLEDKATKFMLDRFPDFMKSSQLQKLTFDNMSALLESNDLKSMSEMDVFAATLKWIMYDTSRQQYIRKLMERIRFPLMPPRDLMVHVNVVDFMRTKCNDLLLEASSYHMLPHSQPIVPSSRTRVRSNDSRLVVVGGADNTDEVSNQLKGIISGSLPVK